MTTADTPQAETPAPAAPEPWTPEPPQWQWRDLFSAPMMAFKPRAALVGFLTVLALVGALFGAQWVDSEIDALGWNNFWEYLLADVWLWFSAAVMFLIFSLGAGFIAIYLKADIVNNELISFGTACRRYGKRLKGIIVTPLALIILTLIFFGLVWIPLLISSIPVIGSWIYAILYPLGFIFLLIGVLVIVGVVLSVFMFPAILAIRRPQSTSDSIMDVVEVVAGRPYMVIANIFVTWLMIIAAVLVLFTALQFGSDYLLPLPGGDGGEVASVEGDAAAVPSWFFSKTGTALVFDVINRTAMGTLSIDESITGASIEGISISGWILGIWKTIILIFIMGYLLNLFLAAGMLTYLIVREDDYGDDDDRDESDVAAIPPAGAETKPAEGEKKPAEGEAKPAEGEAKGEESAQGKATAEDEPKGKDDDGKPEDESKSEGEGEAKSEEEGEEKQDEGEQEEKKDEEGKPEDKSEDDQSDKE